VYRPSQRSSSRTTRMRFSVSCSALQELESLVVTWLAGRVVLVDPGNLARRTHEKKGGTIRCAFF